MYQDLDVLCIGGMVADYIVKPVGRYIFDHDKNELDTFEVNLGGDAANEAIIFGRYGVRVGLGGEMGDDTTGAQLMQYMRDNHVDTSNIKVRGRTRCSMVMIQEDGSRCFLSYGRKNSRYSMADLDLLQLAHTKLLSVGSIHILPTLDADLAEIFKAAKHAGCMTSADMMQANPDQQVDMDAIFRNTDYLLPSFIEAQELTGEDIPEKQAAQLLQRGVKNVVIKLGEEGSLFMNAEESFRTPIIPAEVVDTTGAGDNFVASFLTGVIKGWPYHRCMQFATAAGSIAVRGIGATSCVKSLDQVEELAKSAGR